MITPLSKIASKQAKPTTLLIPEIDRFLQYASKYPNAGQRIRASKMVLLTHSDASYHSESEARSRAGGHIYFGDHQNDTAPNAAVSNISVIIPTVAASAVEAEYASSFIVGQAATSIIIDLGYPQHTIHMTSDNSCAVGIANCEAETIQGNRHAISLAPRPSQTAQNYHRLETRCSQLSRLLYKGASSSSPQDHAIKICHRHNSNESFLIRGCVDDIVRYDSQSSYL